MKSLLKKIEQLEEERIEMKDQLELYRSLAGSINSGIAVIKNDKFEFVNSIMLEYLGYTEEELKGIDSFFDLVDPEEIEKFMGYGKEVFLNSGDQVDIEVPIIRKDGDRIWLRIFASLTEIRGELSAVITAFDNTEMRGLYQDLEKSEKKYKAVLNRNPNNIYLVDKDTMKVVETNIALQRLLGYSEDELTGMVPYDFIDHDSDDVDRQISGLKKDDFLVVGERVYKRKNGTKIDVAVNANIIDILGKEYICVVSWDITDRKKDEAELKELNEVLRLTGRITRHDIRNKLAVALGLLGLMKEGHVDDMLVGEAYRAAQKAIEITKRMNELESIALSRKKSKRYDLHETVEMVIIDYPVKYRIKGSCDIYADDALISVFDNLVGNAINHGGADLIQVDIEKNERSCNLLLSDNGKGIPPEIRDKVFQDSFSFGESKGSGLGLYIVRKIVERYGGSVELFDPVLGGTTFKLTFPSIEES